MAKSKTETKPDKAVAKVQTNGEKALTTKPAHGTPYQLDPAQVQRAATALVKNMKEHAQKKETTANTRSLAADEDEPEQEDEPIFLNLSTKEQVNQNGRDQQRLKPTKISVPHSIQKEDVKVCLFTVDPQRQYKDIVADPAFPEATRAKIGRVLGLEKLQKKYKTYESKRQLLAEYDVFLADDRIITEMPRILAKSFNAHKSKRPIPVDLAPQLPKDKDGKRKRVARKPAEFAKEIEKALSSVYVHLSPSTTTSIRVGKLSQTSKQISENIEAVVSHLTEKKIVPKGWRGIRHIHIKGPTTIVLPIWLEEQAWADDEQMLEEPWKPTSKDNEGGAKKLNANKRKMMEWEEELLSDDELVERKAARTKRNRSRKVVEEKPKTESISRETRKKLKADALKSVQAPIVAS